MKNTFKILLFSLILGMGFVSCTDTFDENDNPSVQPATPLLGFWESKYTNTNADFALTFKTDAKGDTIVEMSMKQKSNYRVDTYPEGKIQSYDASIGLLTVVFPYFVQQDARQTKSTQMQLVYKGTGARDCAFVKLIDVSSGTTTPVYSFTIYETSAPEFGGYWTGVNGDDKLELSLTRGTVEQKGQADCIANVKLNGEAYGTTGDWTVDGNQCSVKVGNEVIVLSTNARYETIAKVGDKEYVLNRSVLQ